MYRLRPMFDVGIRSGSGAEDTSRNAGEGLGLGDTPHGSLRRRGSESGSPRTHAGLADRNPSRKPSDLYFAG